MAVDCLDLYRSFSFDLWLDDGNSFVYMNCMDDRTLTSFFLISVFFGYKLYKSLVERDRKRQEKLKAKQSKKKK